MGLDIDQKIVNLSLNAKEFQDDSSRAIHSLNEMKKALNFGGATKSINNMQATVNGLDFGVLNKNVSRISNSFRLFGMTTNNILQGISQRIISIGSNLVYAFGIEPIKAGLREWEMQINSIQTIMANTKSKGTTLDQVNDALDELNEYADLTIYNFAQMTRNIGMFTAAGVDLDTSIRGIKGIANLAAFSGANAEQAARAMYQLSQAISTGTVRLMDWRSVENASIGGEAFQNQLKQTARVHGIAVDEIIAKEGSFRDSLHRGWLTSEILLETLGQFAGEYSEEQLASMGYNAEQIKQIIELGKTATAAATEVKTLSQLMSTLRESAGSGWAQSWRIMFGDFEEAKALFTGLHHYFDAIIKDSADARNAILTEWKVLDGRTDVIEGVKGVWGGLVSILVPIRDAFNEIFPMISGEKLAEVSKNFANFASTLKLSSTDAENLKITFKGLFSIIKIVAGAAAFLVKTFVNGLVALSPLLSILVKFTSELGRVAIKLTNLIEKGNQMTRITERVTNGIAKMREGIREFVSSARDGIGGLGTGFSFPKLDFLPEGKANPITDKLKGMFGSAQETIRSGFDSLVEKFQNGSNKLKKPVFDLNITMDKAQPLLDKLGEFVTGFNIMDFATILNPIILMGLSGSLKAFLDNFTRTLNVSLSGIQGFTKNINEVLKSTHDVLIAYQTNLKADALLKIAKAVAVLAGSLFLLALIDPVRLTTGLLAVSAILGEVMLSMLAMNKIGLGTNLIGISTLAISMNGFATAVLILTGAVVALSFLSWDGLLKGLAGLAGMMAIIIATAKGLSLVAPTIYISAFAMIELSVAINLLVMAVRGLAKLNLKELTKGLVGLGVVLAEIGVFMNFGNMKGFGLINGASLILMATAIKILESSVKSFGKMDFESLVKGLGAIAVLLSGIVIFSEASVNPAQLLATSVGLNLVAIALGMMAKSIAMVGSLNLRQIGSALLGFGGMLAAIVVAFKFMPKNFLVDSTALVGIAFAFKDMAKALQMFGSMSLVEIGRGLLALGGSFAVLAIGMRAITGAVSGAVALIAIAIGMKLFVPELVALSKIPLEGLIIALAGLAGTFAIFGIAAMALSSVVPVMIALSAAVALLGAGVAMAGAGMVAFTAAMANLAVLGPAGADAFMMSLQSILAGMPLLAGEISGVIKLFARVITLASPVVIAAIETVILDTLAMLVRISPKVNETFFQLIIDMFTAAEKAYPVINEKAYSIILEFLRGIRDHIYEIADVATDITTEFIRAVSTDLPKLIDAGYDFIINFMNGMADAMESRAPELVDACINLGMAMVDGIADGIIHLSQKVVDALMGIAINGIGKFKEKLGINSPSKVFIEIGKYCIMGLALGITKNQGESNNAIINCAKNLISSFTGFLKIHSPSLVMEEQGHYIVQGVAEGITKDTNAEDAAAKKAQNIVNAFKSELDKLDLSTTTADLQYQLWEAFASLEVAKKGEDLTDAEALSYQLQADMKQLDYLNTSLRNQEAKIKLAYDEYNETMKHLGKNAKETQEAYNKYLQEQIDYAGIAQQIEQLNSNIGELQKEHGKSLNQQQLLYNEYIQKYSKLLDKGFTQEEIEKAAREMSGYDPNAVNKAANTAMENVKTAYKVSAESTLGSLTSNFGTYGQSYATAIGNGFTFKKDDVTNAAVSVVNDSMLVTQEEDSKWKELGKHFVESFAMGIKDNIAVAAQQAAEMAKQAYTAAMSAIGIDAGITTTELAGVALGPGLEMSPTITPVVDMTNVTKGKKRIERTIGKLSSSVRASYSTRIKTSHGKNYNPDAPVDAKSVVNNNFTQNNYSPKALSRTEIYRQTKNQFSALKGTGK